ncbi:nose resistant to fluoxetine protein 6 [Cephus cinctus]|uniref:Nose resistant to fluoxetine protein 6 n=1 Tax=Cephus cinctus TaxID=211228 RepID=A0AAJ7FPJ1_CEPCN|nr:nose resistant to fluoxetine protein 6 [Cephus cinctus]
MELLVLLLIPVIVQNAIGSEELLKRTLPAYAVALKSELLNSTDCETQLNIFMKAVNSHKLWGLKMLDSSGAPDSGFFYGNNYWLGSKTQCRDTTNRIPFPLAERELQNNSIYRKIHDEFPPFEINYFVAYFRHNSTLQYHVRLLNEDLITLGLCLPASCSTDELSFILERMFQERTLQVGERHAGDFKLIEVKHLRNDYKWLMNSKYIFIGFILLLLWSLMIVGTVYEILITRRIKNKNRTNRIENNNTSDVEAIKHTLQTSEMYRSRIERQNTFVNIMLCFSIYKNTKTIFNTKLSNDSVPQIHGIRFLGMVWIIMIHTVFYSSDYANNKAIAWRMSEGLGEQIISNSTLSVDTFFFLSGFLVAYLYLNGKKGKEEKKSANYLLKLAEFCIPVLRRFLRLTPTYMLTIGILEINSAWYAKTSQFYMSERPQEICAKYWWRNLLYINNLFGTDTMCMSWSWYMSNDMQFFVLMSFLLILSSMYFYTSVTILAIVMTSSTLLTGFISYINEYVPTMDEQYNMLDQLYYPPWTRIGPYIVGTVTAFILIKLNNQLTIRKRTLMVCWCISSACNILVLFGLWNRQISTIAAAIYVALGRTVWAIGLAWILIACCTKHGGIINSILSFPGWVPFSRLTYCAYLLNPLLINSIYLNSESPVHVHLLQNCTLFLGNCVLTFICSYVLSLMIETPNILLMKLLTERFQRKI